MTLRLGELTYREAEDHIQRGAVALFPIGSTEAHGPHLTLDTDVVIAEETCKRAGPVIAARFALETLIMPALAFTVAEFARPFAGTISIPKATAIAYVRDVLVAASRLGFRAICLVNGHLEPEHRYLLRDAVLAARDEAACPVGLADPSDRRFAKMLTAEFQKSAHAGQYETSLILASDPTRVRQTLQGALSTLDVDLVAKMKAGAKNFLEVGAPDAYLGDPRAATIDEGNATYQQLAEIVATVVGEVLSEKK